MADMTTIGTLETREKSSAAARLWRVVGIAIAVLVVLAVVAGMAYLSVYLMYYSWQIGDWTSFWTSIAVTAFVEIILIPMVAVMLFSNRAFGGRTARVARERDDIVRRALLSATDESAPPEPLQPAPLALPHGQTTTLSIPRMQGDVTTTTSTRVMSMVMSFVFLIFLVPFVIGEMLFTPGTTPPPLPILGGIAQLGFVTYLFPCGFAALIFLIAIVAGTRNSVLRLVRGREVQVSDDGLRWNDLRSRRQDLLRWDEIRAIGRSGVPYMVSNTASSVTLTHYLIASESQTLSWSVSAVTRPRLFQGSETLLRIAVTRTGLPLRDATKLATEVTQVGANARFLLESRLMGSRAGAGIPTLPTPAPRKVMGPSAWGCLGLTVLLIVLLSVQVALGGVGYYQQQRQPSYLANLPTLVEQTNPVFSDSLRSENPLASNSNWTTQKPSKDDFAGMTFTPDGYQLSGNTPGSSVVSASWQWFGTNVAYEVTATQTGTLPQNGGDGVGIVFDANAAADTATDFMVFMVGFDGTWNLLHYKYVDERSSDNWGYVDYDTSSYINTGSGQANKLLLVVRGDQYIIYINNHYITTFTDTYDKGLPTSGYAGVYLDDCALTGTFQNFNVYAVKPVTSQSFSIV